MLAGSIPYHTFGRKMLADRQNIVIFVTSADDALSVREAVTSIISNFPVAPGCEREAVTADSLSVTCIVMPNNIRFFNGIPDGTTETAVLRATMTRTEAEMVGLSALYIAPPQSAPYFTASSTGEMSIVQFEDPMGPIEERTNEVTSTVTAYMRDKSDGSVYMLSTAHLLLPGPGIVAEIRCGGTALPVDLQAFSQPYLSDTDCFFSAHFWERRARALVDVSVWFHKNKQLCEELNATVLEPVDVVGATIPMMSGRGTWQDGPSVPPWTDVCVTVGSQPRDCPQVLVDIHGVADFTWAGAKEYLYFGSLNPASAPIGKLHSGLAMYHGEKLHSVVKGGGDGEWEGTATTVVFLSPAHLVLAQAAKLVGAKAVEVVRFAAVYL